MFGKKVIPIVVVSLLLLGTSALPSRADQIGDDIQRRKEVQYQKDQAQKNLNKLTYTTDNLKAQLAQIETQVAAWITTRGTFNRMSFIVVPQRYLEPTRNDNK